MPKQRLPWFKVWVGATRHEKVVTLDDRTFRAWVELLDAASEQQVRGRFTSSKAAAAIIRRPVALVKRLTDAHLLDERDDGLWLHDWSDWQRWRPDDEHGNDTGLTYESHRNSNGNTPDPPPNDTPPRVERAKTEKREEDVDVDGDKDEYPPGATHQPPKGRRRTTEIDDAFTDGLEERFCQEFGSREAVRDSIATALGYKKRSSYTDQQAFVRNWVRRDAESSSTRRGHSTRNIRPVDRPRPVPDVDDRPAMPPCTNCGQHPQDSLPHGDDPRAGLCGICGIRLMQERRGLRPAG